MIIEIISCYKNDWWYSKEIGKQYQVIKEIPNLGYCCKKDIQWEFYVKKCDARIIEE